MRKEKMHRNKINLGLVAGLIVTLVFMGGCYSTTPEGTEEINWLYTGIFLAVIIGMFYFLMIRPQRKRQKQQQEMMEQLKRGDRVITAGGIYGQIESVSEDSIVIKVESGATMRVTRSSIAGKVEK
jgi:preprotein translocase subunit YajC